MKLAKDQISSKGLPQKGRELVLAEPKDSGKRLGPPSFIVLFLPIVPPQSRMKDGSQQTW